SAGRRHPGEPRRRHRPGLRGAGGHHRCHRHPGPRRPGRLRPPGRRRGAVHLELRAGRPPGPGERRGAQGRPGGGNADLVVPRGAPAAGELGEGRAARIVRSRRCRAARGRWPGTRRDRLRGWDGGSVVNLLTVGISHHSAPVRVLEQVAIGADDLAKILRELLDNEQIGEAFVLSTCNRVEVYAVAETFHGWLDEVIRVLARHAGAEVGDLSDHFYVYYAGAAVEHLFSVAAGLDSMVVGEA